MKNILIHENSMCPKCQSINYKTLKSVTNSIYECCNDCNYNFDKALKQMDFDSILKEIKEYISDNKTEKLKTEIKKDDKKLSLIINDTNLTSIDFLHNILNEDIYFLENTIHELVEDFYSNSIFKCDIIICA